MSPPSLIEEQEGCEREPQRGTPTRWRQVTATVRVAEHAFAGGPSVGTLKLFQGKSRSVWGRWMAAFTGRPRGGDLAVPGAARCPLGWLGLWASAEGRVLECSPPRWMESTPHTVVKGTLD